MFGERSIKLFSVFGIRIGANPSWFIFLFLMIYWLSGYFSDILIGSSNTLSFGIAIAATLLFFISLLLHELGHALAARREGISTSGIDLWLFGGVAKLSRDSDSPGEEFKVAAAGPAVTAIIVVVCLVISVIASQTADVVDTATLSIVATTPFTALIGWLAIVNVALLLFNLVPAFPLDGGRIARAIAWKVTGERGKGTRFAGYLGQGFGMIMIAAGIVAVMRGDLVSGLWFAVLGWFLASAARGAVASSRFTDEIEGITVADVMDAEPIAIPSAMTAIEADEQFFARFQWPWFAVVDQLGRFEGILTAEAVDAEIRASRPATAVGELLDAAMGEASAVVRETPIETLLSIEALRRIGAVLVVDTDSRLCGVVTAQQLERALSAAVPHSS
ncbi:MAG: site-2 protease family protein [Actinomycetes bacterium]